MSQDDYDYDRTYGERWGGDGHRPDDFGPAMTGRHRRVSFTKALGGVFNIAFSALMIVLLALGGWGPDLCATLRAGYPLCAL